MRVSRRLAPTHWHQVELSVPSPDKEVDDFFEDKRRPNSFQRVLSGYIPVQLDLAILVDLVYHDLILLDDAQKLGHR